MGQSFSSSFTSTNPVNYNCPICKSSGKIPNAGGRFFIINDTECKCNGCNTIFEKSSYFTQIKDNSEDYITNCENS